MSGTNPTPAGGDPIARRVRPLPSAPSLEFERKHAKALLKQVRAGKPEAVGRVQEAYPEPSAESWQRVLAVRVGEDSTALPLLGAYAVDGDTLRFRHASLLRPA